MIRVSYTAIRTKQPEEKQKKRLEDVPLDSGLLGFFDLTSIEDVVTVEPDGNLTRTITYQEGPQFLLNYPNDTQKVSALTNLWTGVLSVATRARVTAGPVQVLP